VKRLLGAALLVVAAACSSKKNTALPVTTSTVQRRDIVIDAQASGVIEPINVVEVKSKAGGVITRVPVETGTQVKRGDLLVQVDTRDVKNQLEQANADLDAAREKYNVSVTQKKRSDEMFAAKVITAQEHETAALELRNANTALIRARTAQDLAQQRLEDATVTAPSAGTIIERTISEGMVIASATGSVSGGTTLMKMADLSRVRVRALFNESDIGLVRGGQIATVNVDAYQNRPFTGTVEKIEPQAVIQQNVTMFPVLVTLNNEEGLLKPGMNGEVTVTVSELPNVLAVPNDAVRQTREAATIAAMLNLNPDTVQAEVRAQQSGGRGGRSGSAGGEVALEQQQDQTSGRRGNMPQVTEEQCKAIDAAIAKKPAEKKKIEDIRAKMTQPEADRRALSQELQPIYQAIGVDSREAGACIRLRSGTTGAPTGGRGGNNGGGGGASATTPSTQRGATGNAPRTAQTQPGQLTPSGEFASQPRRPRSGLVFVATDTTNKNFAPRVVQLGQGNFDYTEVMSGLKEGDRVVLISALQMQANRQAQNDRTRQNMGVPGLNPNAGPGGPGGGPGRGPAGGGNPGGGGAGGAGGRGGGRG
jgi:HlyD family secretion protein